jgi:ankyrin repeat protein
VLLDAGANFLIPDAQGRTPLEAARALNHHACVAMLEVRSCTNDLLITLLEVGSRAAHQHTCVAMLEVRSRARDPMNERPRTVLCMVHVRNVRPRLCCDAS